MDNDVNKNNWIKMLLSLICAMAIVIGLFFLINRKNKDQEIAKINLASYVFVTSTGEDGAGKVALSYDKDKFIHDFPDGFHKKKQEISAKSLIDDLEANTTFTISKETKLKNGDRINISVDFPRNRYKDYKLTFGETSFSTSIKGLKEKEEDKKSKKIAQRLIEKASSKVENKVKSKEKTNPKDDFKSYIEKNIIAGDRVDLEAVSYQGKITSLPLEIYVYRINTRENLGETSKSFYYYLGIYTYQGQTRLLTDSFIHRIYWEKENKSIDISYEGFFLVDDLITYVNDRKLKIDGLSYYDNFKSEDGITGYYFPADYTLLLTDDHKLRLEKDKLAYTGSWREKAGRIYLDLPSLKTEEIQADFYDGGLMFDGGIFE